MLANWSVISAAFVARIEPSFPDFIAMFGHKARQKKCSHKENSKEGDAGDPVSHSRAWLCEFGKAGKASHNEHANAAADGPILRFGGFAAHRSISPNTMSRAPRMAVTSASMWPLVMKSIAWRCEKPVGRILTR